MYQEHIKVATSPRQPSLGVLATFSLSALQAAFWAEIERQSAQRGQPNVSAFSRKVAASVFDACLWALRDKQSGNAYHRTLAASTGSGKSSASWAFVSALLKSTPGSSVLYICPDIRQAEDTYLELVKLIEEEDVAIWTTGHDAIMSEVERKRRSDGFEPKAPLFSKAQLEPRRVAVITHSWYVSTKGVHGALNHRGHPRTLHIIDERLKEIDQTDIGHADIIAARDSVTAKLGNDAPLSVALTALAQFAGDAWDTERSREGAAYRGLQSVDGPLEWFRSGEAEIEQRRAQDEHVSRSIAFGRYLTIGHAFLARWQQAKRGGRFVSYKLDLPRIPGTVLLDASSDIDGVSALSPWRATVQPPRATFGRLSIKHLPFPIVDPSGVKLNVADVMSKADTAIAYAEWIKATIISESNPGESILAVTHLTMIDQGRLPAKRSFDDPWVIEGGRKVAFMTYGRGVGSNNYKQATTVFLFGMFYRPNRVSAAEMLGFTETPASGANLGELANPKARHAMMLALKNGHQLRWAKQLGMRGNARNFDENGVCGQMKLVVVGDLDLWLSQHPLLFPGASFTVSEETKHTSGSTTAQRVATYILDHPEGFTSKDIMEALSIDASALTKARKSPLALAAVVQAKLTFDPARGRGNVAKWSPIAHERQAA
jgi:hypothetical protein